MYFEGPSASEILQDLLCSCGTRNMCSSGRVCHQNNLPCRCARRLRPEISVIYGTKLYAVWTWCMMVIWSLAWDGAHNRDQLCCYCKCNALVTLPYCKLRQGVWEMGGPVVSVHYQHYCDTCNWPLFISRGVSGEGYLYYMSLLI